MLRFGTSSIYIGQSINIHKRYIEHIRLLKTNKHTNKLLSAYLSFGIPKLEILCICAANLLDIYENIYIKYFDSCINGLNTLEHAGDIPKPNNSGVNHGKAKYSEEQLLNVLELLIIIPVIAYTNISNITGVDYQTIANIAALSRHRTWLEERSPEKYSKLVSLKGTRNIGKEVNTASIRGIKYPSVVSPTGIIYSNITNVAKFMREHDITSSRFYDLLNKKETKIMGWTRYDKV